MLWGSLCCWQGPGEFPAQQIKHLGENFGISILPSQLTSYYFFFSSVVHLLRLKTKGFKANFSLVSLPAQLVSSQIIPPSQSCAQGTLTYTPPLTPKFVFKVHSTWGSLYFQDSSQFTLSGEEPPRKHAYQGSQRVKKEIKTQPWFG